VRAYTIVREPQKNFRSQAGRSFATGPTRREAELLTLFCSKNGEVLRSGSTP
jgi:hypothetical protein